MITIATYNIRHGHDVHFDWMRLAAHIKACGADIVGLQEVDMGTDRSRGWDTVTAMCEATGLPHGMFIPAMDFDGGRYGTAILSRYPLENEGVMPLPAEGREPRAAGWATVHVDGARLRVMNTHLSYEDAAPRREQFARLADLLPQETAYVLTGDFNTEDFSEFSPLVGKGAALINREETEMKTFRIPPMAIDNIIYDPVRLIPLEAGMIESEDSDHHLLFARFESVSDQK